MSVTRDTSNSAIGPCESLEHSPFGDNLRHVSTALLSYTLDCGEKGQALCETGQTSSLRCICVSLCIPLQEFVKVPIRSAQDKAQRCGDRQIGDR